MDRCAAPKLTGNDGPAPAPAECRDPVPELAGAKRLAPEQGPSDRLVKRVRVRSTM
jgi:hypothetical protein